MPKHRGGLSSLVAVRQATRLTMHTDGIAFDEAVNMAVGLGKRTLYVHRALLNADQVIEWAKRQGFESTLPANDMHVTVCYSKAPVDWKRASPKQTPVSVPTATGGRSIEQFGLGATVLSFTSPEIEAEHANFKAIGASHDYDPYRAHLTISYAGAPKNLTPYDGPLVLGPQVFAEVKEGWKDKVKEVGAQDEIPLAGDFLSVRRTDADGHMFVSRNLITSAQINPYYGREILAVDPNLTGIDPERKYMLLRDPSALEAAVPTLHGKPLLYIHRSQTKDDYDPTVTIGSVMNPKWEAPSIFAELSIIHPDGIRFVESGQKTDLSAGYRYRPKMEPGFYNGQPYDGRMIDIAFNHVTICQDGRVDGAMVGDQNPDAKDDALVTQPNTGIPVGTKKGDDMNPADFLKGKLSAEDMKAYDEMCEKAAKDKKAKDDAEEVKKAEDAKRAKDEAEEEKKKADDKRAKDAEEEEEKKKAADKRAKDGAGGVSAPQSTLEGTGKAMDEAAVSKIVETAVNAANAKHLAIGIAKDEVSAVIGRFAPGLALDSAEAVYRTGLEALGVPKDDLKDIGLTGLKVLFKHTPRPGSGARELVLAEDSKPGEKSVLDDILA